VSEILELDEHLDELVAEVAPELVTKIGVGTVTAGALLVAAGDNPDRLTNERSFAAFCGASPIDASSGNTNATASTAAVTDTPTKHCGASHSSA
jgi:transposase